MRPSLTRSILADLIGSGIVPNTELDIVKRQDQSSGIPEYSKLIVYGEVPKKLSVGNIHFHNVDRNEIESTCTTLYEQNPKQSIVIAPTIAMVDDINKMIQKAINAEGELIRMTLHGHEYYRGDFKKGDQILFTKNHHEHSIQNGTLATLIEVGSSGESFGKALLDTGETVDVNDDLIDNMALGYGITLHKAQGSQFPRVIIAVKKGRITDRSWLYTAITRAESEVHLVGKESDFKELIEAQCCLKKRNSNLANMLLQD